MSDWNYAYPVPRENLTKSEIRTIRRSARRERALSRALSQGALSDVLSYYKARCETEVQEVYATWIKHVENNDKKRAAAEIISNRDTLKVPSVPQGSPPESGAERANYFFAVRASAKAHDEARRAANEREKALLEIKNCEEARGCIDAFAKVAVTQWEKFYQSIYELHMSYLGGANIEYSPRRPTQFNLAQEVKILTWEAGSYAIDPPNVDGEG